MTNDVTLRGRIQGPIKRRVDCKGDLYAKFVISADGLRGRVPCMAFGGAAKALRRVQGRGFARHARRGRHFAVCARGRRRSGRDLREPQRKRHRHRAFGRGRHRARVRFCRALFHRRSPALTGLRKNPRPV